MFQNILIASAAVLSFSCFSAQAASCPYWYCDSDWGNVVSVTGIASTRPLSAQNQKNPISCEKVIAGFREAQELLPLLHEKQQETMALINQLGGMNLSQIRNVLDRLQEIAGELKQVNVDFQSNYSTEFQVPDRIRTITWRFVPKDFVSLSQPGLIEQAQLSVYDGSWYGDLQPSSGGNEADDYIRACKRTEPLPGTITRPVYGFPGQGNYPMPQPIFGTVPGSMLRPGVGPGISTYASADAMDAADITVPAPLVTWSGNGELVMEQVLTPIEDCLGETQVAMTGRLQIRYISTDRGDPYCFFPVSASAGPVLLTYQKDLPGIQPLN